MASRVRERRKILKNMLCTLRLFYLNNVFTKQVYCEIRLSKVTLRSNLSYSSLLARRRNNIISLIHTALSPLQCRNLLLVKLFLAAIETYIFGEIPQAIIPNRKNYNRKTFDRKAGV